MTQIVQFSSPITQVVEVLEPRTSIVEIVDPAIQIVSVAPVQINLTGSLTQEVRFAGQTIVTIDHNLGYRPFVEVTNLAGAVLLCAINHVSINSFAVEFNTPYSGTIRYL
jgi:UDP-N-acetyl-D-mannosaminuronate dehydrogenase